MASSLAPENTVRFYETLQTKFNYGRWRLGQLVEYTRLLAGADGEDEVVMGRLAEMRGGQRPCARLKPETYVSGGPNGMLFENHGLYHPGMDIHFVPGCIHVEGSEFHTIHFIGEPADLSDEFTHFINEEFLWQDHDSQEEAIRAIELLDRLKRNDTAG